MVRMRPAQITIIAAPLLVGAYGVARLFGRSDGDYGPGLDWQVAHLLALAGMILFVPALLIIRRQLRPGRWRAVVLAVTFAGLASSIVQFSADIVEAAMAADRAELKSLQHDFSSIPGVEPVFYSVGPQLFFVGLVAVAVLLAIARRVPWWSPALMLAGIVMAALTLDLIPVAGLAIAGALLPVALAGDHAPDVTDAAATTAG
jgi:hypothetical protein